MKDRLAQCILPSLAKRGALGLHFLESYRLSSLTLEEHRQTMFAHISMMFLKSSRVSLALFDYGNGRLQMAKVI